MRRTAIAISATLAISLAGASSSVEAAPTAAPDGSILAETAEYAVVNGVDTKSAASMMANQQQVETVAADLSADVRVTGFWIDTSGGEWKLVVGLRSLSDRVAVLRGLPKGVASLTSFVEQQFSEQELADGVLATVQSLRSQGYHADGYGDVQGQRGVVVVEADALPSSAVRVGSAVPIAIQLGETAKPSATLYAGQSTTTCTSGFTVVHSDGRRGITTAGHCTYPQDFLGNVVPMICEWWSGSADVEWHTNNLNTFRNWAYDGINDTSTPYYRTITGTLARLSTVLGGTYCKYGKVTGYDCGVLNSRTETATEWVPNSTARYLGLDSKDGSEMSIPGDSGGPAYTGNTAIGLISGWRLSHYRAVIMSMDGFAGLPIRIATS